MLRRYRNDDLTSNVDILERSSTFDNPLPEANVSSVDRPMPGWSKSDIFMPSSPVNKTAAFFNGAGANIKLPNGVAFVPNGDWTIEFWLLRPSYQWDFVIFQQGTYDCPITYHVSIYVHPDYGGEIALADGDATASGATVLKLSAGVEKPLNYWNHVAFTRNGSTYSAYVNGVNNEWQYGTGSKVTGDFNVIGCYDQYDRHMHMMLSEFRIWNVARTEQQIYDNFAKRLNPPVTGLIHCWHLDDIDTTIADSTTNANHGEAKWGIRWFPVWSYYRYVEAQSEATSNAVTDYEWTYELYVSATSSQTMTCTADAEVV